MIEKSVIIVGGGPAGAACAWKLGHAGVDYLLIEKAHFPRFKPCAGWVTPRVFKILQIDPGEYPHSLAHFNHFQVEIKEFAFRMRTDQFAIRRVEFDHWLLTRTILQPVEHAVRNIANENGKYILDGQYTCTYLVGAGGTNCPVRKFLSNEQHMHAGTLIVAMEEEFHWEVADPACRLWFLQNGLPGYAWYVPKPGGFLNIGIGGSAEGLKKSGDSLQHHWQLLVKKLERDGLVRGHEYRPVGHSYHLRGKDMASRVGNVFLTGDALGLATLDMGEGIGPAIESGIRAAEAILTGEVYSLSSIPKYSFPALIGLRR